MNVSDTLFLQKVIIERNDQYLSDKQLFDIAEKFSRARLLSLKDVVNRV